MESATRDGAIVPPSPLGDGRLADNIVFFARALRKAGLKIGPAAIADAIEAVETIGIGSREEFHAALSSIFVKRHEDLAVFDEAFRLFWRSRDLVQKMIAMMSPVAPDNREKEKPKPGETRVSDALLGDRDDRRPQREAPDIEIDARFTTSGNELLRRMDFAQMSVAEIAAARKELARLELPLDSVRTRRFVPSHVSAKVDPRATMRVALRTGGTLILPRYREAKEMQPPLVVLADISGSMSQYTRIFLHFLHVLTEKRRRVHTFLFGTRLTNVSRQMRHKDPDEALDECAAAVRDWSGGTRIGETLKEFNRLWARRVLGQGAIVLLITDGLEREGVELLQSEMDRLHRSCRRLIWLNPLLRFEGFEPRARGVRAMLPHVDEFRPVHNLLSLADLVSALSAGRASAYDPRRFLAKL
ncbi:MULTISPECIES: VWA domain-containing protein [unclassified Rhizobium]|uniref:vWA domain-containing protein n=1 Tax=unclassified Rhizobium TaxID=2613769 RepID=UPI000CDF3CE3|nr:MULTISPECIES: VWA domain-containing protein [Rhizobium]AVA21716.1 von Willebrand factor A domain-containing CoxE-like protein [Rhizobium sp. NXC24]MDK4737642.1 VWA domain-containing protein [Rhizobium sp. CNPSo 3464]UWU22778.1 VWA domain-containing protein [Rhizobium tropici]